MASHFQIKVSRVLQGDRKHANRMRRINVAVPAKLQNQIYSYVATVDIGTPKQTTGAAIDTGSSDLWVFSTESGEPNSYDPSKSSSYKLLNHDFSIQYVSGSASGDWATENIGFGDYFTTSQQFAVVNTPTQQGETVGIFGIGQESQETVAAGGNGGGVYPNFPALLKQQGKIKANAYSLYLDSIASKNGSSLTFGGLDVSRYKGQLYTVPFTSSVAFSVDFEVVGTKSNGVLDSGTSLTYLDQETVDAIAQRYGAEWDEEQESYLLQGSPATSDPLVYSLSGAEIQVPISELFIEDSQGGPSALSILPTRLSQGVVLLGDSFLRSAYVVYHLDANIAGIAQANWSPGESKFVDITGDSIPGAKPAPGVSSSRDQQ